MSWYIKTVTPRLAAITRNPREEAAGIEDHRAICDMLCEATLNSLAVPPLRRRVGVVKEFALSVASWLRRNAVYPLWVAKDRSPRLRYLGELERSQYLDRERLRALQFERLKGILVHAYRETAWYRRLFDEIGFAPEHLRDSSELKRVPLLTKESLRTRQNEFLACSFKDERLVAFRTGGSTGVPVEVLKDTRAVEIANATALRAFRWAGWRIGEPVGMIWGNPPISQTLKERLRDALIEPAIYLDTMNLTDVTMFQFVDRWRRLRPSLLRGHSHSIFIFASFCRRLSIVDVRPRGIISSSMMLLPTERRVIEAAFDCKVTDLYGCEEVGLIACECERHEGMHLDMETNYVELLDQNGNEVGPGEDGAVVVTNLLSRAMPLIRYRMGDVAAFADLPCTCGRTLPLLSRVSGRVADFLVRKDGSVVAGVSLVERTLTKFSGIAQMQIVQEDLDNLVLKIVKDPHYTGELERALVAEFKHSVGEHNTVRLEFVDAIPQERSGKFRFAISRVTNPFA